jgi:Tfp pilus assembly protein PilO
MPVMLSVKRNLIDKSNTTIVAVISGACFILVFCVVASASLLNQMSYQNRVITAENNDVSKLKADVGASQTLETAYNSFMSAPTNLIGGNPNGSGAQDGINSKIILDALPSTYDYPALATSLQSILSNQGVLIESISGTDQAAAETSQSSANPTPQPMPFQVTVQGDYAAIQNVINTFERSIRPLQIQTMELSGDQSQLNLSITAQTYWQPAKNLNISTEVIQ